MDDYAFHLFSSVASRSFASGDPVFVWLKSNRSAGRAVVLAPPDEQHAAQHVSTPSTDSQADSASASASSQYAGRYLVRFTGSDSTAHVRPERLLPVFPAQQRRLLVVYSTIDYRRLARSQVSSSDVVLELGCSYGVCTNVLSQHTQHVIGIDNSQLVVAEARSRFPHVRFEVADVLEEPAAVLQLIRSTNSNISSSNISSSCDTSTTCAAAAATAADKSSSCCDTRCGGPENSSSCSSSRGGSVNVVFVDIGGNRQLEALVRLLPWVLEQLQPRLLVVKSEELAEAALEQLQQQQQQRQQLEPQQQQQQGMEQQQVEGQQQEQTQPAAPPRQQQRQGSRMGLPAAASAGGRVLQPAAWWQQLEVTCHLNTIGNSGRAEPWYIAARAGSFKKHPLRLPQRFTKDGIRICRPHNYTDRCFKTGTCEFDHTHCHHCGVAGHRAVDCPVGA